MASGIARGRALSPTTTAAAAMEVSHQYGDLSHASLVNIRSNKFGIAYRIFMSILKFSLKQ